MVLQNDEQVYRLQSFLKAIFIVHTVLSNYHVPHIITLNKYDVEAYLSPLRIYIIPAVVTTTNKES